MLTSVALLVARGFKAVIPSYAFTTNNAHLSISLV